MLKHSSNQAVDNEYLENLIFAYSRYLTSRPHTEREVRIYLVKKVNNPDLIDKLIIRLKQKNIIDDSQFITWWVGQRADFKPKGQYALTAELLQKGISKELIDRYFEEEPLQDIELARQALLPKAARLVREPADKRFRTAVTFLQRRGFSYTTAKNAFEDLFSVK